MISCPSCNVEQDDASDFCSACGAALKPGYEATVTHGISGHAVHDGGSSASRVSHHGRFLPGTKVANRYRIVSLIGKGGMGEVYRADDLKLGHTVALKFLPRELADDPQRTEYFHSEVRLTRQISHPNVCRVYDIGDTDGQRFLSMEYIDGEDLKLLLRRIGRLPKDKGIQIAQQLCEGLAAAHEKGVLHRDLKPANIMIDGRGQVRITDFGLAKLAVEKNAGEVVGTPQYMAPEQLSMGATTIQSDLYSLGLILYEMFTGEPVNKTGSIPELLKRQQESSPNVPSSVVEDIDPVVERVILRCLEKEPHERPKSAHAVAAALPGGDPLAEALKAGETPSPEMVAAAGETFGLSRGAAATALTALAFCLLLACWLADQVSIINQARLSYEPAVLAVKARELVQNDLGYTYSEAYEVHGFREVDDSLRFWYRQRSGMPFTVENYWNENREPSRARPSFVSPPLENPGELGVQLAPDGRLLYFRARPPLATTSMVIAAQPSERRWSEWFRPETTGFYLPEKDSDSDASLTKSTAQILEIVPDRLRTPPDGYDAVRVWKGTDPHSGAELYVEAAAWQGMPVYFEVFSKSQFDQEWKPPPANPGSEIWTAMILVVLAGGSLLGWFNVRTGRGDRRGAMRIALFAFWTGMIIWLTHSRHSLRFEHEFRTVFLGLAPALTNALYVWVAYIACEPLVRRFWPQILISWTRLLAGRFRAPDVGRDFLLGALGGICVLILFNANSLAHLWLTGKSDDLWGARPLPLTLAGSKELLGEALAAHLWGLQTAAIMLTLLVLLRIVLQSKRLALIIWFATHTIFLMLGTESTFAIGLLPISLVIATHLLLLVRFGFLALVIQMTTYTFAGSFPLTLEVNRWYFSHGMFAVAWISGIALYGYYTSLGGQSLFGPTAVETQ